MDTSREPTATKGIRTVIRNHKGENFTTGISVIARTEPMDPSPIAIFLSLTGGFSVENIVFVIYGWEVYRIFQVSEIVAVED